MEVTFSSDSLASAAQALQNVVNAQTTMPILQNALIQATAGGGVTIFASDMESYAKVAISAEVTKPGRATVPAKVLAEATRDLPNAPVKFSVDGTKAKLECEKVRFQLATMPADEFPEWPEFKQKTKIEIAQSELREALSKTLVAVPTRDPRKVLLGVFFDLRKDGLRLVGTDGKKLVVARCGNYQVEGDAERGVVVPHKVAAELHRQLDEAGTVKILIGERQIAFDNGRLLYVSNVIEGQYPQYEMVVPKEFACVAKVPREALSLNIRRASTVQDRQESRVILAFENNALKITSFATEVGEFESALDVEYTAEPIRVCFNYAFLNELLKTIGGDTVLFNMNKPATPVVLKTPAALDDVFLIMPVKLTEYSMDEGRGGTPTEEDEPEEDEAASYEEENEEANL